MSGKAKMRCARCHKPFKASSAKQTLCAECEAKERRARAATKTAPATPTAAAPAAKPKIVGPAANILVPGLVPPPPSPPASAATPATSHDTRPQRETQSDVQPGPRRPETAAADNERERDRGYGYGQGHAQGQPYPQPHPQPHPQQQGHGGHYGGRGPQGHPQPQRRAGQPRPPAPARPKREPAPTVTLTPELRERIEARYRELAQPVEFDGIRTRIATELAVPKTVVKKAVLELRQRDQMPSWWELQGFHGSEEDLGRIRAAYAPHLPVPAVGVHKQIATDLGLDPGAVYQAIRRIRAEMHLPQYNPPESHAAEAAAAGAETVEGEAAPAHANATAPTVGSDVPEATAG